MVPFGVHTDRYEGQKMRRLGTYLALCLMTSLVAAAESSTNDIVRISIMGPGVWHLQILPDGSGSINWAASSHPNSRARFPKGALDFSVAHQVLRSMPSAGTNRIISLSVAFFQAGDSSANSQDIQVEIDWARTLFTRAFVLADKTGTRVEEFWREHPPFPHNKATSGDSQ